MKKIFLFILLFICLKGFSQFPSKQTLGSPTSKLEVLGGVHAVKGLINGRYADTTAANLGYIDSYHGSQIYTTTDKILWLRDSVLNKWVQVGSGVGSTLTSGGSAGFKVGVDATNIVKRIRPIEGLSGDSLTSGEIALRWGQTLAQAGNPAILTASREIPFTTAGQYVKFYNAGTEAKSRISGGAFDTHHTSGGGLNMFISPGGGNAFPGVSFQKGDWGSGIPLTAMGVHWEGTALGNKHQYITDMRDSIQYSAIESAGTHMAAFGTLWNGHHTDLGAKGKVSIGSTGFLDHAGNKGYLDNYKSTYLRDSLMLEKRWVVTDSTGFDILVRSRTSPYETKQLSVPSLDALIGGGGGGSSLFPVTGTGTATGNVTGDLGTNQTLLVSGNIATEMMTVSNSGAGAALYSTSGGPAYFGYSLPSSTNTVVPVMQLQRGSSGTPANGIGGSIDFYLQPATGFAQLSNQLISKWTNATAATRTSQVDLTGVNSAATEVFANFQTGGIVRVNNLADTLATRAYARSVGGSGGETNTASNLGGGLANYSTKVGVDLQFNSFFATDFDLGSNLISIDYANGQKASNTVSGFVSATTQTFSAGKTFNAPMNVKGAGAGYLQGIQIINSSDVAQTSMLHAGGSFFIGLATAASGADASGDFIQRIRAYEETATGTNPIVQLGDNDLTIYHDGTANYAGNFGLGTVPTEKLTVNGQVRINAINNASVFDSVVVINNGVLEARLASTLVTSGSGGGVLYYQYPLYEVNDSTLGVDTGAGRSAVKTWVTTKHLVDSLITAKPAPTLQQVLTAGSSVNTGMGITTNGDFTIGDNSGASTLVLSVNAGDNFFQLSTGELILQLGGGSGSKIDFGDTHSGMNLRAKDSLVLNQLNGIYHVRNLKYLPGASTKMMVWDSLNSKWGTQPIPSGGGGSQTPWTSDIDGDGFDLTDVGLLSTGPATITNTVDASVPLSINLSAGQSGNAFNITPNGGAAGDIFNIDGVGNVTAVGITSGTYNKVTITAPATSATLTLVTGSSLITAGAFATTLTATGTTNVTLPTMGTLATLAGTETLSNKTLTTPNIGAATASSIAISGQISSTQVTLTDGATVTWSWTGGTNAVVTLAGNRTLSITNAVAGTYATLKVIQDGTGSRTLALPGSGASKVVNGGAGVITLTTTAAAVDIITVYYDGTSYFFSYGRNYN